MKKNPASKQKDLSPWKAPLQQMVYTGTPCCHVDWEYFAKEQSVHIVLDVPSSHMSGTRESFGWALQPGSCSLIGTDCPHCKGMSLRMMHSRATLVFRDELLAFSCPLRLHVLWNRGRSSRTMKSSRSHLVMSWHKSCIFLTLQVLHPHLCYSLKLISTSLLDPMVWLHLVDQTMRMMPSLAASEEEEWSTTAEESAAPHQSKEFQKDQKCFPLVQTQSSFES